MRLRPARRRLVHHLALPVLALAVGSAAALLLDSDRTVFLLSMGSAYASLALLAGTLLLGPWNVVRGRPNPVSTHLRRDVGIWAALLATVHVVMGLQVHMQGHVEQYFLFPPGRGAVPLRYDAFGLVNWMGVAATVIALVLLAISNDLSLRRLGTGRWKRVQRWNYALFALVVVHGLGYQLTEGRPAPWVAAVAVAAAAVAAGQAAGWRARRRDST